ncbi:hypothetical protein [Cellulomonas sp. P24]|uniref:hypothetical protein n=1 Tax=Cellulomonas sp. P24 TaxID=2885206 RepID=UPI00216AE28A|nr:hypothetical protein [Cellulomonas sp. P24]MCR6493415.1 hypothetical protein [Cellulomonas sp. P24]
MSKARYPYPADEFDAVDAHAGPRGVHRRARSVWTRVWPFLLVIVLFPAIAWGGRDAPHGHRGRYRPGCRLDPPVGGDERHADSAIDDGHEHHAGHDAIGHDARRA